MCPDIMSLVLGGITIFIAIVLVIINYRKMKINEWIYIVLLFSIAFSVHGLVHKIVKHKKH